mmetsp:Transcript_2016/g.3774  ORF Transcript_2016/g.3774 Transcript_2016/m.3774 type:complete len:749 (-) Transcript_2016:701-2947(-)
MWKTPTSCIPAFAAVVDVVDVVVVLFLLSSNMIRVHAAAATPTSTTTTTSMPTDFIDCNNPCNGGDVNYELIASVQTIKMGFGNHTYRGRTFARPDPSTGRVPDGAHMGPTLTVSPGQSMWIKFRNELHSKETKDLRPLDVTTYDYWSRLITPGEKIKYQYYKNPAASPDLMEVDTPNVPKNFDATNLHLHGLDVQVHMFDPVGTHNPHAPHVKIQPGECYCYRFRLPNDHPDGLYWYHPHLHGSSAVQLWGGMMGLVKVVEAEETTEATATSTSQTTSLLKELAETYNVRDSRDFVVWDPAFQSVAGSDSDSDSDDRTTPEHDIEVDEFLLGQTTLSKIHPFLVNGQITPKLEPVVVGQVLHLRVLCATIENEFTFIVYKAPEGDDVDVDVDYSEYDWKEHAVPIYVVASDGVTYSKPRRRDVVVFAGGQREELLLQFDEPGKYVVSQQGIQGMQFFGMYGHPHDQLLAEIHVVENETIHGNSNSNTNEDKTSLLPTVPIQQMVFTPGYKEEETIESHQIARTETIVFSMGANRNMAPFPQYYINGKAFSPDRIDFHANPGEAVEYILINANHNYHPFHIHVNRFQVKEMGSELSSETYPILDEMTNFDPGVWRDTVAVPPNGRTRIWVQYKNYTGKTVLHCHFLAHEDTGMMSTLFIGSPDDVAAASPGLGEWRDFPRHVVRHHLPLLIGCGVGVLLGMALLALLVCSLRYFSETEQRARDYYYYHYHSVVQMNEVKTNAVSKALD